MTIKLYTCNWQWLKLDIHHCYRVEKALIDSGIEYEPVRGPISRRHRERVIELTGQNRYPVIQFEDGSVYRDSSRMMAEAIRAGRLEQRRGAPAV